MKIKPLDWKEITMNRVYVAQPWKEGTFKITNSLAAIDPWCVTAHFIETGFKRFDTLAEAKEFCQNMFNEFIEKFIE